MPTITAAALLASASLFAGASEPVLSPEQQLAKDLGLEVETKTERAIDEKIVRVQGDADTMPELRDGEWVLGDLVIDSPLPVGYPRPTPPEVMEIKEYPSVRRAEYTGEGMRGASNRGFMPLFRHISRNDIAMTAPVEMDLPGWSAAEGTNPEEWTMSFLYRVPELRETGTEGDVVIRDTEPLTVVSMGTQGVYTMGVFNRALAEVEEWLDGQTEWERAGDPRWFGYNGPMTFPTLRWGEVQIPIQRVESEQEPVAEETAEATDTAASEEGE